VVQKYGERNRKVKRERKGNKMKDKFKEKLFKKKKKRAE
jgi:hypothetical protein